MSSEDTRVVITPAGGGASGLAETSAAGARSIEPPSGPAPFQPGTFVKQYELIRRLGEGGMGSVHLARDTRLGRLVAIKFLLDASPTAAQRLLAEARATARCRHENIVVIHEVDELDGQPYLVLEYVEGRTLRAVMAERRRGSDGGRAAERHAAELMIPVARALACAHGMGLVHRDLKPENILLAENGAVRVVDFGIAKQVSTGKGPAFTITGPSGPPGLTGDDELAGTFGYMAPEQWLGGEVDGRTDLWAAGVILYELLLGAHPLSSSRGAPRDMPALSLQLSHARLMGVPRLDLPMPGAEANAPGAPALAKIIDRCLRKRKDERVASAAELLDALEAVVRDEGAPAPSFDDSPYAGLAAFQEADAARFFGREQDIVAVLGKLRNQALVAITGPSGAGKSSFVRAGVIPALKRSGPGAEALVLRPGRAPLTALAGLLASLAEASESNEAGEEANPEGIVAALRSRPGMLGARLRARCKTRGPGASVVLFVDQLEELYTQGIDAAERSAFHACIEGVADDASSPLRVLVTIRADFLDRLAEDRRLLTEVTRGLFFLPPMGREAMRDALTRPLAAAGHHFEDDALVEEMLDGLDGARCPLPLLQFAATLLWEARDRDAGQLTRAAYSALGGVAGALSAHADAVISGLSAREQRLAREVFVRLVTPERTRAVVPLPDLLAAGEDAAAVEQVVAQLGAARLVMIEAADEREAKRVELVHESLIDRWAKLERWLAEGAQDEQFLAQLRNAAQQWSAGGEAEGLLWRDRAALEGGQWLERREAERGKGATLGLGPREERYLRAVVALSQRAQRRRRRIAAGVFAAVCAVAVTVTGLAVRSSRLAAEAEAAAKQADRAAARANEEARQARNATRMATAKELEDDPTMAFALLREVEGPGEPRGFSSLARSALSAGVAERVLEHPDNTFETRFSPGGERIAVPCRDGNIYVWDVESPREPLILRASAREGTQPAWSPDGKRIAIVSTDRTARVWNADGSGEVVILRGHEHVVHSVAWSPDGEHLLTDSLDGTARVWSADGAGEPVILRGGKGALRARWSPDSSRILSYAEGERIARVWNAGGTGEPMILRGHEGEINSAAWSPDGNRIVTVSADRTARVWDADGAAEARVFRRHADGLKAVAWSPDGRRFVATSDDGTARIWDAGDATGEPVVLQAQEDKLLQATFDPSGAWILTQSFRGNVRLWRADGAGDPAVLAGERTNGAPFDTTGKRFATSTMDGTVHIFRTAALKVPRRLRLREPFGAITRVEWSLDGKQILSASRNGVSLWPVGGTAPSMTFHDDRTPIVATLSPDGRRFLTGYFEESTMNARVWSADGTGEPIVLRGQEPGTRCWDGRWSPDGKRIVVAYADRTARVWNADGTGEPIVLRGHEDAVWRATWSPDGRRIATSSADRTARVWNADGTGEPIVLRGHEDGVSRPAWSPDGKRIATSSRDRTVRIWNADGTGEPLVLHGHESYVLDTAWSPDGKSIATGSADRTVRIWSADGTGDPLVLRGEDFVSTISWSPDSTSLVAATGTTIEILSDLEPVHGASDPRLWTATTYCPSVARRVQLLGVSEDTARANLAACERRVDEARRSPRP